MKCPGLARHGQSFRLVCRVPADVRRLRPDLFPKPLRSHKVAETDTRKAHAAGFAKLAEWSAEYDRIRATGSQYKTTITNAELSHLIALMLHSSLSADEESREAGEYADDHIYQQALQVLDEDTTESRQELARGVFALSEDIAREWLGAHGYDIPEDSPEYRRAVMAFAKARAQKLKTQRERMAGDWVDTPAAPTAPQASKVLMLSDVVSEYLARPDHKAEMLKKHKATLSLLLDIVGDKPVAELLQKDIYDFLRAVCKLPPRWYDKARQQGLTARQMVAMEWPESISPKTYEDGYVASLRVFLIDAFNLYGDQKFPPNLNTKRIKYSGEREEDERQQRALTPDELRRLFRGPEYQEFAADPAQAHRYWLPLLGLFTGARLNELCQLNPQCDIQEEGGIHFIDITKKSPADPRITKTVKNTPSQRRVPIHSELIRLGFLRYVERVRSAGHMLLFPDFPLKGKNAGAGAGRWFGSLLEKANLRDTTHGRALVGFHAFRSNFLNRALHLEVHYAPWLTGHIDPNTTKVLRGYQGLMELQKKQEVLERITFDLVPLQHSHDGPAGAAGAADRKTAPEPL